jgi:hypothetical protein
LPAEHPPLFNKGTKAKMRKPLTQKQMSHLYDKLCTLEIETDPVFEKLENYPNEGRKIIIRRNSE